MMKEDGMGEKDETNQQIKCNIKQTYLLRLQEVTRKLRALEKEHLKRVTDLYGEEGEAVLDALEKREKDFLADDADERRQGLIQVEELGQLSEGRQGQIKKLVS